MRRLETAASKCGVKQGEADEGFAVVDLVGPDHLHGFGERDAKNLNLFVDFGCRGAFSNVAGEIDLHEFAEEAGTGVVLIEEFPLFCTEACLFDHLAFGCGKRSFAGFDAAGGEFKEELANGVAVLTLDDDVGVFGVLRLVDGEDDDGAGVVDDIALVDVAVRLLDGVGVDIEYEALVGEL